MKRNLTGLLSKVSCEKTKLTNNKNTTPSESLARGLLP